MCGHIVAAFMHTLLNKINVVLKLNSPTLYQEKEKCRYSYGQDPPWADNAWSLLLGFHGRY